MKTKVDTSSEIGQKLAQIVLTKKLVDAFNLHPSAMARSIVEDSKKNGLDPNVVAMYLYNELPKLVDEFLTDTLAEVSDLVIKAKSKKVSDR